MTKMQTVLSYHHAGVVNKLKSEMGMSEGEAIRLFHDMVKFLWLCGTKRGRFSPTKRIDEAWHRFILFTKDYHEFCNKSFGRYIHHGPIGLTWVSGKPINGISLLAIAREVFTDDLNPENWLGQNATSWVGCDAGCAEEHEPHCSCKDCEHDRYLKTPEGKAKLRRKEDKRKKDLALRKPLDIATEEMEKVKRLVKDKEVELKNLKSDVERIESTLKSLLVRVRELKKKEQKNQEDLPKLKKKLADADEKVQREKEIYNRLRSDNLDA